MPKKRKPGTDNIEKGMAVEATEGDLGESDLTRPKVTDVVHDEHGKVEKVVVTKGVIFKKKLDVPADRITSVKQSKGNASSQGEMTIDASEAETEALSATGEESLALEDKDDLLDQLEQEIPTVEGLREKELDNVARERKARRGNFKHTLSENQVAPAETAAEQQTPPKKQNFFLHVLGPGFLGGMAGNDASAVTSYSVDGATVGYGHLWLLLLATPFYQSVQYTCAKIGRMAQKSLAEILREHYSAWVAIPASLILICYLHCHGGVIGSELASYSYRYLCAAANFQFCQRQQRSCPAGGHDFAIYHVLAGAG